MACPDGAFSGAPSCSSRLSVAIRPAETVLVLVPPVALGVAWGMYKGCFSVGAVLVSAALLGAGVCVWMLSVFVSPEVAITVPRIATDGLTALTKAVKLFAFLLPVVAVCGAVWMVWQERRKPGEPSHRLVLGSLVFAVLMVTWWAPFARGLFEWVYENTLGPTIRNAPLRIVRFIRRPVSGLRHSGRGHHSGGCDGPVAGGHGRGTAWENS